MLRDERLVVLNDLTRLAAALARHYQASAELLPDRATAALCRRLAGQREALAARLRYHVEALGDLPDEPDADREWLGELVERLRARLGGNPAETLLRDRVAEEDRLAALAAAGLDQPVPEAVRETLRSARDEARSVAGRLRRRAARRARD